MKYTPNNIFKKTSLILQRILNILADDRESVRGNIEEESFNTEKDIDDWDYIKYRLNTKKQFNEYEAVARFERILNRNKKRRLYRNLGIAASFVLPLTVYLCFYTSGDISNKITENAKIHPGKDIAYITLSDGEVVKLDKQSNSRYNQGAATISIDSGKIKYMSEIIAAVGTKEGKTDSKLLYNKVNVPRGAEFFLVLSDGTEVWINSQSTLKYPVSFTGDKREVRISGEAFFKVKKDRTKPFIVHTSKGQIEVLGTSFNVRDYSDEEIVQTTLVEGEVALYSKNKRVASSILKPSWQGTIMKDGSIEKKSVDTELYTSWKDGRFVFRKQRLEYIMGVLARWYDIEVFYANDSQKEILFSGDIKRYDDFDRILKMLEMAGDTDIRIKGKTVIISEK